MQKLDDATAHMTFLAMVADLQHAWQVNLDAPDDYFDFVRKLIEDWWEMRVAGTRRRRHFIRPQRSTPLLATHFL